MNKRHFITDPSSIRHAIHDKVLTAIREKFPVTGRDYTANLLDVRVQFDAPSHAAQRDLLTSHRNASDRVYADIEIVRNKDNKRMSTLKNKLICNIPYYTNRYTLMLDGNEYSVVSQMRTKSGIYTRKRGNDDLESSFNLAAGANFKLLMQPATGIFTISILKSTFPAVGLLKILGTSPQDLVQYIGKDLAETNLARLSPNMLHKIRDTLFTKLVRYKYDSKELDHYSDEEKEAGIRAYFARTRLDPETTRITLGAASSSVTAVTLLQAMKKLLSVYKGTADVDERDLLEFQKVYSVEDLLAEVITKNRDIIQKLRQRLDKYDGSDESAQKIFAADTLTEPLHRFVTGSSLSRLPAQINPMEFVDSASIITRLGEGAIGSERAVPFETRGVNYSYMGIIDPIAAPESFKVGIDAHCTLGAMKGDDNEFYKAVTNCRTGQVEDKRVIELFDTYVGFPDPVYLKDKKPDDDMAAVHRGKLVHVPRHKLDYQISSPHDLATVTVNTCPFMPANQGNRLLMGAKHVQQALPLKDPDTRLVKSGKPGSSTVEMLGSWTLPRSPVNGVVSKITDEYIYVQDAATGKEVPVDYENNLPLATKTFLNNTITVKTGDHVQKGQPLADSNFSRNGELTMGKNLSVAYMPWEGMNHEDGLIVSEECARKMTSVHSDKVSIHAEKGMVFGKSAFTAAYPTKFTTEQLNKLDGNGLARKGVILETGDPIILALEDSSESRVNRVLGMLHRSLRYPYRDVSRVYDGTFPAEVVATSSVGNWKTVVLKIEKPLQVGDKLAGSYGNKGTCSKILPVEQMPVDEDGRPVDMVFSSVGVISRINAGQILESALGKIARKTGKPYAIENYSKEDYVQFVKDELKKHGVKDKETLTDPTTGKKIPNVFVGVQHYHKLFKTSDTNFAARGVDGPYDMDDTPTGSGFTGPKALGNMEINALLAHNALSLLHEGTALRSSKNLDFWKEFQRGGTPRMPVEKKTFTRFTSILKQAGINVKKDGDAIMAMPLTDKDILAMSNGAITNGRQLRSSDLQPEKDGLFDTAKTGGITGKQWTHIRLVEPVINPIFTDAIKSVLNINGKTLEEMALNEGGKAVRDILNKVDVDKEIAEGEKLLFSGTLKKSALDKTVKRIKYLKSLQELGMKPGDAYTLSLVPVLPPSMRPMMFNKNGESLGGDANMLYSSLIQQNDAFSKIKESNLFSDSTLARNRQALNARVAELTGKSKAAEYNTRKAKGAIEFIAGDTPKRGYFQSKVIYGKMNLSGRATISPDTSLGLDEVGLPKKAAWAMYKPFIARRLAQMGYAPLDAEDAIREQSPLALQLLEDEMAKRPVIVNRAPTLWRHSVIAARPLLRDGKNLRINSIWEKGLNADYDGDAMQIHLPVSDEAVAEAKKFFPSQQMFSDKKKDDLIMQPSNEPIIGLYKATANIGKGVGNAGVHKFANVGEAWKAYYAGKLKMTDFVEIG